MTAEQLVQKLSALLLDAGRRVCTAESCTGGLIAKTFTDLAGSSDWFERGFVTYSNAAKSEMLAVPPTVIEDYGAVSEPVAVAMASGALRHSQADYAIAVTGASASLAAGELDECRELARRIGIRHEVLQTGELSNPDYQKNTAGSGKTNFIE